MKFPIEPVFSNHCQCRDCQHKSGTGHGSYMTFPSREAVKLKGEAAHWDMVGDSGNVKTRALLPDLRVAGLSVVQGDARSLHHSCGEPRRSRQIQAAGRDLRRARLRLGPSRSGLAEIRQDAAGMRWKAKGGQRWNGRSHECRIRQKFAAGACCRRRGRDARRGPRHRGRAWRGGRDGDLHGPQQRAAGCNDPVRL